MLQSGHLIDSTAHQLPENYTLIAQAYRRKPIKPVLDGEPIYEDTPDAVWLLKHIHGPRASPDAVRRRACGRTRNCPVRFPAAKRRHRSSAALPAQSTSWPVQGPSASRALGRQDGFWSAVASAARLRFWGAVKPPKTAWRFASRRTCAPAKAST